MNVARMKIASTAIGATLLLGGAIALSTAANAQNSGTTTSTSSVVASAGTLQQSMHQIPRRAGTPLTASLR